MYKLYWSTWLQIYLIIIVGGAPDIFKSDADLSLRAGVYVSVCGSGRAVFIPLNDDKEPDPAPPSLMVCHAICSQEDNEEDEIRV